MEARESSGGALQTACAQGPFSLPPEGGPWPQGLGLSPGPRRPAAVSASQHDPFSLGNPSFRSTLVKVDSSPEDVVWYV